MNSPRTRLDDVEAVPTEPMPADDPFLLMFTSGTSGKPKGVVHSHCGFPVKTALDLSICMDLKPEDRFLWMSDMGWLVGPILVFGGLLVGCTVVLAEGAPNYPEPDRLWRLVERHRVSYLGLAPTVARLSMSQGEDALAGRTSGRCASSCPPASRGRPRPGTGPSSAWASGAFPAQLLRRHGNRRDPDGHGDPSAQALRIRGARAGHRRRRGRRAWVSVGPA